MDPCPLPPVWGAVDGGGVAQALWNPSSSNGSLLFKHVSRWRWHWVAELAQGLPVACWACARARDLAIQCRVS